MKNVMNLFLLARCQKKRYEQDCDIFKSLYQNDRFLWNSRRNKPIITRSFVFALKSQIRWNHFQIIRILKHSIKTLICRSIYGFIWIALIFSNYNHHRWMFNRLSKQQQPNRWVAAQHAVNLLGLLVRFAVINYHQFAVRNKTENDIDIKIFWQFSKASVS